MRHIIDLTKTLSFRKKENGPRIRSDFSIVFTDYIYKYLRPEVHLIWDETSLNRGLGERSGEGAALLVGRSRDRSPVMSLGIFSMVPSDKTMCPEVDSASENEYQGFLMG